MTKKALSAPSKDYSACFLPWKIQSKTDNPVNKVFEQEALLFDPICNCASLSKYWCRHNISVLMNWNVTTLSKLESRAYLAKQALKADRAAKSFWNLICAQSKWRAISFHIFLLFPTSHAIAPDVIKRAQQRRR
jgi:hypothetical protein